MSFLEKNIESIIYNNLQGCIDRGFHIRQLEILKTYRQLALGSAGIADLVIIGRERFRPELVIQIIECKKETISLATYGQALRYQQAIDSLLASEGLFSENEDEPIALFDKILVGQKLDARGDFYTVVHSDMCTSAFTYDYGLNGVTFEYVDCHLELARQHNKIGKIHRSFREELVGLVKEQQTREVDKPDLSAFFENVRLNQKEIAASSPLA